MRRHILYCVLGIGGAVWGGLAMGAETAAGGRGGRPNVVLILADDMGTGELGCYGQKVIRTPNIDALAREGMRFTQAYSPSPVCAPTRCSLLTGLHQGHAYVRDNKEIKPEGQTPIPAETITLAELMKQGGYATACVGKWGLGPVGSEGDPLKQGFDFFYGHNCQRVAHNHYTDHVWRNDERVELEGNTPGNVKGKQYAPDLMADEAINWMKGQNGHPFFMYFATPLPHVSLQAPEDAVAKYRGVVEETKPFVPVKGDYVRCDEPRATYAAMVSRVDDYVGRIEAAIKEMGVEDNTLVVFASDNGPTFNAGTDSAYFHSAMGLRGLKEDVYEGGIRVPLIVRWPGHVKGGTESSFVTALYDLMPTFLEATGLPAAKRMDGVSLVPVVEGKEGTPHEYLYFEFGPKGGQKAVRQGNWKAVWTGLKKDPKAPAQLYDLEKDPAESTDVAKEHPEVVEKLTKIRDEAHEPAAFKAWNF